MRIPLGEWLPDLPALENPGAPLAKNCIPDLTSYRPLPSPAAFTAPLDGRAMGGFWARDQEGTVSFFAGTNKKLYRIKSNSWTDLTPAADYSVKNWSFEQFGNRVIACDRSKKPQYYDLGSTSAVKFQDLPGNPPTADHVAIVRDFLVLGNLTTSAGSRPGNVQWSGINNSEAWGSSLRTQAGSQELRGQGGMVQRIIGGEVGIIFQERTITRMTYVGPPVLFRFDEIERGRGAVASGSVVWTGAMAFYYANDGFYALNLYGGEDSVPIGANRVNRWFKENASASDIIDMVGALDYENSLVIWAFKTASGPNFDRLIIYNWQANRWSFAEVDIESLVEFASVRVSLEGLDTVLQTPEDLAASPVRKASIDAMNAIGVDSNAFKGGQIFLMAFDTSHRGALFSGTPLIAEIDTKELSFEDSHAYVDGARPLVESAQGIVTLTPVTRDRLIDNPVAGLPYEVNQIGICDVRTHARYTRYRLCIDGDFAYAHGVEVQPARRGRR